MSYREAHLACHRPLNGPAQVEITGDEVRDPEPLGAAPARHRRLDPGVARRRLELGAPAGALVGTDPEARQIVYDALLEAARRRGAACQAGHRTRQVGQRPGGHGPGEELQGPAGRGPRHGAGPAGRDRRAPGAERRGKTTTFYLITGLIRPDAGRVLLDGLDLTRAPMFRRARDGDRLPGPGALDLPPKMTVEENILAILETRPLAGPSATSSSIGCWTSCRSSTSAAARPTR